MRRALDEARRAAEIGEVPVGAVVVRDGQIIGHGHNRREGAQDPVAHAEIRAIRDATNALESWRLVECTLYVTLEPCLMCGGAIVNARVPRVVFGATDPKAGAVRTLYTVLEDPRLNHSVEVTGGVLADECGDILTEFFQNIRTNNRKDDSDSA